MVTTEKEYFWQELNKFCSLGTICGKYFIQYNTKHKVESNQIRQLFLYTFLCWSSNAFIPFTWKRISKVCKPEIWTEFILCTYNRKKAVIGSSVCLHRGERRLPAQRTGLVFVVKSTIDFHPFLPPTIHHLDKQVSPVNDFEKSTHSHESPFFAKYFLI